MAKNKPTEAGAAPAHPSQQETAPATVRVRLLVSRAGTGFSQNRGDEVEVSASEAESIVAAGQAEVI